MSDNGLLDMRKSNTKYRTWDNVGVYRYSVSTNTTLKGFLLHRPEYFEQVRKHEEFTTFDLTDRAKGDINTFVDYFKMWVNDYDNRHNFGGHPDDWHKLDRINEVELHGEDIEVTNEEIFNEAIDNRYDNHITINFDMVSGINGEVGFHTMPFSVEISIFNILSRTGDWWNLCKDSLQDWWFDND